MIRLSRGFVVLALLAVLAFSAAPARAAWFFIHGAAAVIQPSSLTEVATYDVAGWGLRVTVKKGKSVWIHAPFANPALDGTTVNTIQLIWKAASKTIYVSGVDVYDGSVKFWAKQGNWKGTGVDGNYAATNWSLGRDWNISRGFGISFAITNKGGIDQEVIIASAGASFDDK